MACSGSVLATSHAMNAGTSIIRFGAGRQPISSCSIDSLTTFSDTRPPSAGQTSATASSSAAASGSASGRLGNTVSRLAVTAR